MEKDAEKAKDRVREEFGIVYRMGMKNQPVDIDSAMLNVDALIAQARSEGYEKGREEKEKEFALRLSEKDFQRQEVWNEAIEAAVKVADTHRDEESSLYDGSIHHKQSCVLCRTAEAINKLKRR